MKASDLSRDLINWILKQNIDSDEVLDILDEMLDRYTNIVKLEAKEESEAK